MRGLGATTTVDFAAMGMGNTTGGSNWWQNLVNLGAATGSQIALAQWGNAPTYQQANTPYGSSTTVYGYAPGTGTPVGSSSALYAGGAAATGDGTMVLLLGGLMLILLMGSGR